MNVLDKDIIEKYYTNSCSNEELQELSNWLDESKENKAKLFGLDDVLNLSQYDKFANEDFLNQAELKLCSKIEQNKKPARVIPMRFKNYYKYAAIIIVLLVSAFGLTHFFLNSYQNSRMIALTATNKVVRKTLPDGTKVWLNVNSSLKYPKEFSDSKRTVILDGEAFFKVSKNPKKPFIVKNEIMNVKVLGTVFDMKCNNKENLAYTSLLEGEVEVSGNYIDGKIILSPGQRAELNKFSGKMQVKQVNTTLDAIWHNGLIPFEEVNIYKIAQTLEQFYDKKIIISPDFSSSRTYSGAVMYKKNLSAVLDALKNSIPMDYRIEENRVFIFARD